MNEPKTNWFWMFIAGVVNIIVFLIVVGAIWSFIEWIS